jgi:cellulose 1,4-beta-cellobiosidase
MRKVLLAVLTFVTLTGGVAVDAARASTQTLTRMQVVQLDGNKYHLQANEWGSSAPFSITNDFGLDFKVATSSINTSTSGAPGAYPSFYRGCHWGNCTASSGLPLKVSTIATGGKVRTSYATSTISTGAWDSAYDIWFNPASATSNNGSGGLEMMLWLNKLGPIQPAGSRIASGVVIGGRSYDVWKGGPRPGGIVSYVMHTPATSVSNLDLGPLVADAVARGYMTSAWYLISVEAGFELWQGGAGLAASSFNVCDAAGC